MKNAGTDVAIVLGAAKPKKPMFGAKPDMGEKGPMSEDDGGDAVSRTAMETFIQAVADRDVGAALKAWSALPCPSEMRSSSGSELEDDEE